MVLAFGAASVLPAILWQAGPVPPAVVVAHAATDEGDEDDGSDDDGTDHTDWG